MLHPVMIAIIERLLFIVFLFIAYKGYKEAKQINIKKW